METASLANETKNDYKIKMIYKINGFPALIKKGLLWMLLKRKDKS